MVDPVHIANKFDLGGNAVSAKTFGSGHINDTYKVVTETAVEYLLQRINHFVFKEPDKVVSNYVKVNNYLAGNDQTDLIPSPIKTLEGEYMFGDQKIGYWRVFPFLSNYYTNEILRSPEEANRCAHAFGVFAKSLVSIDSNEIDDTIPGFS